MIRINLLPVREARRRADMQQQLAWLGLVAGVSIGTCILLQGWTMASISSGQSRVATLNEQISQFQTQLQQVEDFKRKATEIEKKLEVIRRLDLSRTGPVRLLDEIATRAPQKLWLSDLVVEGNKVELEGMSLDTELIAEFLTRLNDSPYLDNVELESTELAEADGLKLNRFIVTAELTNPELAEPERAPAPAAAAGAAQG
ncbi:hypothetical protein MYXO_02274 [Myxococcaceae bacterium]|jgi:type IV pilus assembly protein PilN|nr:hypothetical protein MYXO_02274 [Myxococcaceae bacterium]